MNQQYPELRDRKIKKSTSALIVNGNKTFMRFPKTISNDELPPPFLISEKNNTQSINHHFQMGYYTVDRIFDAAVLTMNEQRIFIHRNSNELS
jgi:type IV secretory pathway VirB9-like protein